MATWYNLMPKRKPSQGGPEFYIGTWGTYSSEIYWDVTLEDFPGLDGATVFVNGSLGSTESNGVDPAIVPLQVITAGSDLAGVWAGGGTFTAITNPVVTRGMMAGWKGVEGIQINSLLHVSRTPWQQGTHSIRVYPALEVWQPRDNGGDYYITMQDRTDQYDNPFLGFGLDNTNVLELDSDWKWSHYDTGTTTDWIQESSVLHCVSITDFDGYLSVTATYNTIPDSDLVQGEIDNFPANVGFNTITISAAPGTPEHEHFSQIKVGDVVHIRMVAGVPRMYYEANPVSANDFLSPWKYQALESWGSLIRHRIPAGNITGLYFGENTMNNGGKYFQLEVNSFNNTHFKLPNGYDLRLQNLPSSNFQKLGFRFTGEYQDIIDFDHTQPFELEHVNNLNEPVVQEGFANAWELTVSDQSLKQAYRDNTATSYDATTLFGAAAYGMSDNLDNFQVIYNGIWGSSDYNFNPTQGTSTLCGWTVFKNDNMGQYEVRVKFVGPTSILRIAECPDLEMEVVGGTNNLSSTIRIAYNHQGTSASRSFIEYMLANLGKVTVVMEPQQQEIPFYHRINLTNYAVVGPLSAEQYSSHQANVDLDSGPGYMDWQQAESLAFWTGMVRIVVSNAILAPDWSFQAVELQGTFKENQQVKFLNGHTSIPRYDLPGEIGVLPMTIGMLYFGNTDARLTNNAFVKIQSDGIVAREFQPSFTLQWTILPHDISQLTSTVYGLPYSAWGVRAFEAGMISYDGTPILEVFNEGVSETSFVSPHPLQEKAAFMHFIVRNEGGTATCSVRLLNVQGNIQVSNGFITIEGTLDSQANDSLMTWSTSDIESALYSDILSLVDSGAPITITCEALKNM